MSQNAWKKQAEANKANQPAKPPGAPPPWMKNKAEQPPAQQAGDQSQTPPPQQQPPPQVQPVAQQAPPPPSSGPQKPVPAWMKNKQQSGQPATTQPVPPSNPPPFGKPATTPVTSGSQPAWMKNKQTQSPVPTERVMEDQRAKEEEELKKKKEQQIRKQQQMKRQERENKMMAIQEQLSKAREQQDKKKPQKRSKKSPTKKAGQATPLKPLKRLKNPTPVQTYHLLLDHCLSKSSPYQQKLSLQKQFLKNLHSFCQSIESNLSAYLVQHKPVPRKKNIINLDNIVAEYALVEGVSGDIGSMYFKCKNVENLENKFSIYSLLFLILSKLAKKNGGFRLRVPLLTWVEVKGMYFLCEGVCEEIIDSVASPAENFVEIHGQLTQLQKQLKQAGYDYLDRKMLSVKKITIAQQQYYILYLSQVVESVPQSHPSSPLSLPPFSPLSLQKMTSLPLLSTNSLQFPYSVMKQSSFSALLASYPTQRLQQSYIQLYQVAHAIRVVYASCQGELQEQSFWKLVFDGNKNIWAMAATVAEAYWGSNNLSAEFKDVKEGRDVRVRNRIALSKVIETMLPVRFGIGIQRYSQPNSPKKQGQGRKRPYHHISYFRQKSYPMDNLQLVEISQIFPKTITSSSKNKLSEQALLLEDEIIANSEELYFSKLQYRINKSLFLLQKGLIFSNGDLVYEAISNLENYEVKRGMEIQRIGLWMTLVRVYMEAVEANLPRSVPAQEKSQENEKSSQSQRYNKSKLQQSQVREVQNSSQLKKAKEQGQEKSLQKSKSETKILMNIQVQYENKMLQKFGKLLSFIEQLFEDEVEIWVHAELYMVLAMYYAKRGLQFKKNQQTKSPSKQNQNEGEQFEQGNMGYFNKKQTPQRQKVYSKSHVLQRQKSPKQQPNQSDSQSLAESQLQGSDQIPNKASHKYSKQCQKLLQTSYPILLQYYGNKSEQLAEHLLSQAEILYNINEIEKCENSVTEALKIYKIKSLAKNGRNIVTCNILLAKCLIRKGKKEENGELVNKGVAMLQGIVSDLGAVAVSEGQVMEVYRFLCDNVSSTLNKVYTKNKGKGEFDMDSRHTKMQIYLQKMAQMSLTSTNIPSIKQILSKIVSSQLQFYSKQRAIALKQLHQRYLKYSLSSPENQESEQQMLEMNAENIKYLEENKQNYGGLIEMIKWSFGILRAKGDNSDGNKAIQIMENVLGFFRQKELIGLLRL